MLSSQEDQIERRRVLANDQRVREQQGGSAYIDHYMQEAGGRFSAHAAATVVGSKPDVASAYPPAAAHQADPCGPEPPTGYRIDQMIPDDPVVQQGQDGPAPDVPASPLAVERSAGSPLSRLRRF
jgi:hypothetical protein